MNIKQIRKCYDLCDELEKQGLELCFINAIRGTLSVKQTVWNRRVRYESIETMTHPSLPEDPHFVALNFV